MYRCLRRLSIWVAGNYYSEVVVEGAENVPESGPVILASTHRNESIDVAILAVTVPHGRQVSYWAKASLFKNPVVRWVMESSGAIPVQRGAENAGNKSNDERAASQTQADLFRASTACLMAGGTLGVFPEGFSATLPGIGELRSGAAWAAVEHDRAARLEAAARKQEGGWTSARIVPVSIVYVDAPGYQSRVCVRYGKPIETSNYYGKTVDGDALETRRIAVTQMVSELRSTLGNTGIDAPDWSTLHAAKTVLQIHWDNPNRQLSVRDWVVGMQGLVSYFASGVSAEERERRDGARFALARYYALQLHTRVDHCDLQALLPHNSSRHVHPPWHPVFSRALVTLLRLSIRTTLCLPALLVYLPAYATSAAATALLTRPDEPESYAQVAAVTGGLGLGLGFWAVWSTTRRWFGPFLERILREVAPASYRRLALISSTRLGKLAIGYVMLRTMTGWHDLFARENKWMYRRTIAAGHVLLSVAFPAYQNTSPAFDTPPVIAENPYARSKVQKDLLTRAAGAKHLWKFTLISRLLIARQEAMGALEILKQDEEFIGILRKKGD